MTEPIDESPAGRFMEGILAAMSQFDNEQRAERTRVGLRASAQMGRWVFKRPLGYLNSPRGKGGPSLAPDGERAPLIRKAFELCAKGRPEHEILATQSMPAGFPTNRSENGTGEIFSHSSHRNCSTRCSGG